MIHHMKFVRKSLFLQVGEWYFSFLCNASLWVLIHYCAHGSVCSSDQGVSVSKIQKYAWKINGNKAGRGRVYENTQPFCFGEINGKSQNCIALGRNS